MRISELRQIVRELLREEWGRDATCPQCGHRFPPSQPYFKTAKEAIKKCPKCKGKWKDESVQEASNQKENPFALYSDNKNFGRATTILKKAVAKAAQDYKSGKKAKALEPLLRTMQKLRQVGAWDTESIEAISSAFSKLAGVRVGRIDWAWQGAQDAEEDDTPYESIHEDRPISSIRMDPSMYRSKKRGTYWESLPEDRPSGSQRHKFGAKNLSGVVKFFRGKPGAIKFAQGGGGLRGM